MTKVKVECISKHMPNEILEVDETRARGLIERGDYVLVDGERLKELEKAPKKPVKVDVSVLSEKSKKRVKDIVDDLEDDGKRNYSHKK